MSTPKPSPLDAALDLLVYVPVGLALTVGEELPKLAAKGRSRLGSQVTAARMVGQLAVVQGRRQMDRRRAGTPGPAPGPASAGAGGSGPPGTPTTDAGPPSGSAGPAPAVAAHGPSGSTPTGRPARTSAPKAGQGTPTAGSPRRRIGSSPDAGAGARRRDAAGGGTSARPATREAVAAPPEVGTLAIPQYDALSASQVVTRLAGLAPAELDAVARYEAATRGRRTILARAGQLRRT